MKNPSQGKIHYASAVKMHQNLLGAHTLVSEGLEGFFGRPWLCIMKTHSQPQFYPVDIFSRAICLKFETKKVDSESNKMPKIMSSEWVFSAT